PAAWLSMSTPEYPAALEPMVAVLSAPTPRAASSAEQAIRTASDDLRLICPAPAGGATPDSRCDRSRHRHARRYPWHAPHCRRPRSLILPARPGPVPVGRPAAPAD